jgi:hypothetical protein
MSEGKERFELPGTAIMYGSGGKRGCITLAGAWETGGVFTRRNGRTVEQAIVTPTGPCSVRYETPSRRGQFRWAEGGDGVEEVGVGQLEGVPASGTVQLIRVRPVAFKAPETAEAPRLFVVMTFGPLLRSKADKWRALVGPDGEHLAPVDVSLVRPKRAGGAGEFGYTFDLKGHGRLSMGPWYPWETEFGDATLGPRELERVDLREYRFIETTRHVRVVARRTSGV